MPISILQSLLDGIRHSAFVLDRKAKIHFRNRAARLHSAPGGKFIDDPKAGLVLADDDGYAAYMAALEWFFVSGEDRLKTLIPENVCLVLERVQGDQALVVARFNPLMVRAVVDADDVERLLKLTPAQARLSVAIFEGKSVKEYAVETDTTVSTVRWHLSETLKRVACRNQVDLIRLIAQLP